MSNKKFILNADDLGLSKNIDRGVIDGYNSGVLKSTSLCANGETFEAVINEIIPECPELCIGVHLNIIEGKALTPYEKIPMLVNKNGYFNNSWTQILTKSCNKEFLNQVEIEFRAQIERITAHFQPAHIDSHVHTHGIPNIFDITCKLAQEYNIPYVRTQFEQPYITPIIGKHLNLKYPINQIKVALLNSFTLKNLKTLKKYPTLKTNKYLVGVSYTGMMDNNTVENGLRIFKKDENILVEALIHPYYNEKQDEYLITQNKDMKFKIENFGFEFTTYKKLVENEYEKI